jgi:heptosyltransferase-3
MRPLLDRITGLPLRLARHHRPRVACEDPRILVIRRNRMGDMLCTLPLLRVLRIHFPAAQISVACDEPGAPIAKACTAVDRVILLNTTWTRRMPPVFNAVHLQNHDWVIVTKGGFDRRLARLAPLTHAAVTVGFEDAAPGHSDFYTHPVVLPLEAALNQHQIETQFRLLQPLDISVPRFEQNMLDLRLPESALRFARTRLAAPPFSTGRGFAVVNLSCNRPVGFDLEDYARVIGHLLKATDLSVMLVGVERDQVRLSQLASRLSSSRVAPVRTEGALELAALLKQAALLLTPEGGAGHLAAAMQTPTVVLWQGAHGKWRPRGPRNVLVPGELPSGAYDVEKVCGAIDSLLGQAKG